MPTDPHGIFLLWVQARSLWLDLHVQTLQLLPPRLLLSGSSAHPPPCRPQPPPPPPPLPCLPQGYFNCDACGHQGTGFSYHCSTCNLDFHILCASMPLSLSHHAHSHPLHLAFFPPYQNKGFSCDICLNMGSNHWLYRCSMCEFDAHLGCVGIGRGEQMTQPLVQAPPVHAHQMLQRTAPPPQYINARAAVPPQMQASTTGCASGIQQNNYAQTAQSRPSNGLFSVATGGFVDGAAQQVAQILVQSFAEGNGGGGNGGADAGGESGDC